ncbi:MAG: FAD:protein FMN transferase, partial [Clostridia bacterium]|nr:FAD:protein FMN transferase [Clostridia bacterium]
MKKTAKAAFAVLILLSFVLSAVSCGGKRKFSRTDVTVFDTETVITGYDTSEKSFNEKADAVTELLREYHKLYDIYNEYEGQNNLMTVNLCAGKEPVKVDERIIDLIEFSKEMYVLTDGKTNIAMGSVTAIWHEYREAGVALPSAEELLRAEHHTDIENIICDREKDTVYLADPEMSLDVGAVAKGYAAEKAAQMIEEKGWTNIALSVGGNIRTVGAKGDGTPWITGIQNPDLSSKEAVALSVSLENLSCVTSGSYQRYYELDGVRYHHIIDPETLFPENRYLSVSVVCADSGKADALSTAL